LSVRIEINVITIVDNDVKLAITFINLNCVIELKINVSWNNTPFDYCVRVIISLVFQGEGLSVSCKIDT